LFVVTGFGLDGYSFVLFPGVNRKMFIGLRVVIDGCRIKCGMTSKKEGLIITGRYWIKPANPA